MRKKYLSILSFCLLTNLTAQYKEIVCCFEDPQEVYIEVRQREPNGIGYPRGYSTVDAFVTPSIDENFHPFLDARVHVFNNGKIASNVGLGLRYLPDVDCVVFGLNAYWDYSHARHVGFNQIGVGAELLFQKWDFHANGYIPVSRTKKHYREGFSRFQGNSALFFRKYETAMTGGDLTVGYMLYDCGYFDMHAALSGYYFGGNFGKHAGGGLFKVKYTILDYITLEGQVSYDNLFKWIGQGELGLRIPLGKCIKACSRPDDCCDLYALQKHISRAPDRFEIIVTTTHKKKAKAIDPVTGIPLHFIFVNNTSSSNGTFESPFPTLAQAQAASTVGDVIYVFPGNGSTTGMNAGIVLKDNQKLIGSNFALPVSTPFGTITIPPQTASRPNITSGGAVVTLANNNQVSGVNLLASNSISGTSITNAVISSNNLVTFTISGAGNFNISNNTMTTASSLTTTGNSNIVYDSNVVFGSGTNISLVSLGGTTNMFFTNNSGTLGQVNLFFSNSVGSLVYNNNRLTCIGGNAPLVNASNSTVFFAAKNNVINSPVGGNSLAFVDNNGDLTLRMSDNLVLGSPTTAFLFNQAGTGTLFVESPNSQLSGFQTINRDPSGSPVSISGNVVFIPY